MRARGFRFAAHVLLRIFRIASALAVGIVFFLVIVLFVLNHLIEIGEFRRLLVQELEERTLLKASVGAVEMDLGGVTGVSLYDFSLVDPLDARPVLSAPKVVTRIALLPLWNWQIVIQDIRFDEPTLWVTRDESGTVDVLEIMGRVLFQKRKDFPFTLDLKQVRIDAGQVRFRDDYLGAASLVTELRQVDLSLRRASSSALLDLFGAGSEGAVENPTSRAVDYRLKTLIGRDGKQAFVASGGTITFSRGSFQLRQASMDMDLQVERWPPGLLQEYYQSYLPAASWSGVLNADLHLKGTLAGKTHVRGAAAFKDLRLYSAQVAAGTVSPGSGRVELEMEVRSNQMRVARFQLRSEEVSLTAQGSVLFEPENDPYLQLRVSTPFMPVAVTRGYLPVKFIESPRWQSLVRALNQGEVRLTRLDVNGRVSELSRPSAAGPENRIGFTAEMRGVAADFLPSEHLPVRNVTANLSWENGVLYFKGVKGSYGRARVDHLSGFCKGIFSGSEVLEAHAQGELDLEELRQQWKFGLLPETFVKGVSRPEALGGKAAFDLFLRKDVNSLPAVHGRIILADGILQSGEVTLRNVSGPMNVSAKEITAEKITASFAGSPLTLKGFVRDYSSEKATYELTAESTGINSGEISRLFFGSGSIQDPGTIRGWLRYRGTLNRDEDRKLTGVLELVGTQPPLSFSREPLRQVSGVVRLDEKTIELKSMKAQVANFGFQFSGQLTLEEKPRLEFTLSSPEMDISLLLPRDTSPAPGWYERLEAAGKINIAKGRFESIEFFDLKSDLFLRDRVWRLENFTAGSAGGKIHGRASFLDRPKGVDYTLEPKIEGVPVQQLLGWFDVGTREITGDVYLAGKLESSGVSGAERKRNMNGHFKLEIQNGVARRLTLLVRILHLMDLTRWFSFQLPDLTQKGIRFRRLTGDFKITQGIYTTENLVVDSDDISITGAGRYDAPNDVIDAVVVLRPFPRLASVANYVPLIGPGIAGVKDSILLASFRVQGPVEEAMITPAPLSTLSESFFNALKIPQRMLTLPGAGNK